jgi:hypothetical protein
MGLWITVSLALVVTVLVLALVIYLVVRCKKNQKEQYDREKSFTDIFRQKLWGSNHPNGEGSLDENTQEDCDALIDVLKKYRINTMLDAPCGLFSWMRRVLHELPHVDYSGMDIVKDQVEQNKKHYPSLTFFQGDVSVYPLKKYDLVFSKECTQHLKESTTLDFLRNILKSGSTYLLITSFDVPVNSDDNIDPGSPLRNLDEGAYREQNLLLPPYSDLLVHPMERFFIRKNPYTQTPQYLQLFRLH